MIRKGIINADGKSNIKIRVSHRCASAKKCQVAYIKTQWYIEPRYMASDGKIKPSYPDHNNLNNDLMLLQIEYNKICNKIDPLSLRYMSIAALVKKLTNQTKLTGDFLEYIQQRIESLRGKEKHSVADSCEVIAKHLKDFRSSETLLFKEITPEFLKDFENWLIATRAAKKNTIRNYMCNIRTTFKEAISDDIIESSIYPFKFYAIEQEKRRPRPLDAKDIRRLYFAQEYLSKSEQRSIDVFFLIFFLGGINFKDLVYLRNENLYKGSLTYIRFKTEREYTIKVYPEAQAIFDKYKGNEYLLSFIEHKKAIHPAGRHGYEHKDLLKNTNKYLKKAGEKTGIQLPLKTYVARYSFATIAAKQGISKDVIAHILGHGIDTMTDLYIDFDQDIADKAVRQVIDSVAPQHL